MVLASSLLVSAINVGNRVRKARVSAPAQRCERSAAMLDARSRLRDFLGRSRRFPRHPAFHGVSPLTPHRSARILIPLGALAPNGGTRDSRLASYGLQIGTALVLIVASLWAATQWAAAMLGLPAGARDAWIDLLGLKVYAPWKLFVWWLAFDAQAPDVFARAGAVAAFGGIASGAVAIGGAAWRAEPQATKPQPMARPAGRTFATCATPACSASAASCSASIDERYLRHDGPEHVLAVAPTRSGKGVGLVRADAADLARLRRRPRHQGRELGS